MQSVLQEQKDGSWDESVLHIRNLVVNHDD